MASWLWVVIAFAVLVVVAVIVWQATRMRRSRQLRERFGPEYERTLASSGNSREAERELAARQERQEQFELRPLTAAARDRYLQSWQTVQARFVDSPEAAVVDADLLIQSVMAERGYPVEDFEQRAADVSVEHPDVVQNYREGHRLARLCAAGDGSTEELRQAMRHYRALFEELVEPAADAASVREQEAETEADRHEAQTEA